MAATILITGASGLIGFRILLEALAAGHNIRYTVRSEEKAQIVSSNPAVEKLAPGDRLTPVVIPDLTVDGVFDDALKGVTHVIHAGSPVPVPTFEPKTQVYEPTVKILFGLLASALKTPSVQRIVITSSIVGNIGLNPPNTPTTARARAALPDPLPTEFGNVIEAYIMGKMVGFNHVDEFVKTKNPHFTVAHVVPGYIFGRNELALDATMMQTSNSSNNFLIMGMLGGELPFPIHGGYAHIDDVADIHLRVAFLDPSSPYINTDFGVSSNIDYSTIFDHVEKAFPKAVADGTFKRGNVPTLPVDFDSSETAKLGGPAFKSFESGVVDVAAQYLEKLGKEKA